MIKTYNSVSEIDKENYWDKIKNPWPKRSKEKPKNRKLIWQLFRTGLLACAWMNRKSCGSFKECKGCFKQAQPA